MARGKKRSASAKRREAWRFAFPLHSPRARHAPQDAIALLKADHRQVEEWFSQFEKTNSSSRKQDLAQKICTALKAHTTDRGGDLLSGLPGSHRGGGYPSRGRGRARRCQEADRADRKQWAG